MVQRLLVGLKTKKVEGAGVEEGEEGSWLEEKRLYELRIEALLGCTVELKQIKSAFSLSNTLFQASYLNASGCLL